MNIAYLTTDDVNLDLAQRWAEECGCQLTPLSPRDATARAEFDAVICDLDYLPEPLRQQAVANLQAGDRHGPAVVHGYNLEQMEVRSLRAAGIHVAHRLERGLIQRLAAGWRAAAMRRMPGPKSTPLVPRAA